MTIGFFCPRWGNEHLPWSDFCKKAKAAGYDGIEYAIPASATDKELDEAWKSAEKHRLLMLPQHYDTTTANFYQHLELYERWLIRIRQYPAMLVNSQTGKDHFSFAENCRLIALGNSHGVVHETHRGKFSFAAHVTKTYLEAIPGLRLTLDCSHWVCVAESLLEDQEDNVLLAISRADHIHARVGYPEGPQVTDPQAPEWAVALERHLTWWDAVVARKRLMKESLTVTCEFGPFPYMVHSPGGDPVADQWTVNVNMLRLLKERYT